MKSSQKYDDGMENCTSGKCVFPTKNTIRDGGCIAPLTLLTLLTLFILFSLFTLGTLLNCLKSFETKSLLCLYI